MHRTRSYAAALAVFAFAACVDSQAPEQSPTTPSTNPAASLPVIETMQVTAPLAESNHEGFNITLRFVNTPDPAHAAFFETAAARWQGAITGDMPNVRGGFPPETCGASFPTPAFGGEIDDVLIDVLLQPIDGPRGVLGAAGPCLVRTADFLTLYGIMFFDVDDVDEIAQLGIFDEVVVHEMGHVLGLGTLWDFGRDLLQGPAADPRFVGPNAINGFHDVGGRGATIPVEEDGGPGTAFGHWDEETFDTELMTGFIALSGESPLSVMTILSMQDMGYQTNPAAADDYRVRGRQERVDGAASVARINLAAAERLLRPVGRVE